MSKVKRTNQNCYLGLVTRFKGKHAICLVNLGAGELTSSFPANILKAHGLKKNDRFKWWPTESGTLTKADIKPYPFKPINERKLRAGLKSLCNPKNSDFV